MEDAREMRQQGIRAAKAGQKEEARRLLQQSLRVEPDSEPAWLWLASVANNNRERIFCLNKVLELNPRNETALKALESLDETPGAPSPQPAPRATGTMQAVRAVEDPTEQQPGIPVPTPDRIAAALPELEKIARAYSAPIPRRATWGHKTRSRAGERDIVVYRLQVAAAAGVVMVLLVVGFLIALQNNADLQYVVYGPSATPTPSPTITPTFTPGLSATPSATPRLTLTPSATVPGNVPAASPPALPRATAIYPPVLERFVLNSIALLDQGQVPQAVATLSTEREQNFGTTFNASVYYYEALGLARQGSFSTALQRLAEADEELGDRPENIAAIRPYLDSAYAQVYDLQAQRALDSGGGNANEAIEGMRVRAESAIEGDPRLEMPYLLLARDEARQRRFADAIEILNRGLNIEVLAGSTNLLLEKARLYVEQRNLDAAAYQLYLVHYVDPSIEAAYELKYQIGLERNRIPDAVSAAQDYLYYYPGETRAYRLLGEAYAREGKPDLALSIYTRGLSGSTTDSDTAAMLSARAAIFRSLGEPRRAIEDYSRLLEIDNDPGVRAQRMETAVEAGRYADALEDAEALAGSSGVGQGIVGLVRGRALVESATAGDTAVYQRAASALETAASSPDLTTPVLRALALEYLARAQYELRNYASALESIQAALAIDETGSRRYWRGRIYEADNDERAAIADYEFVVTWGAVYPFAFRGDAAERLDALRTA
ncbi:MAG: tetratricopeptide repeat protein [Chloroflexota bacterium]|nr:tetratricopeptide repeat protein [Chloroflexota bacterium]